MKKGKFDILKKLLGWMIKCRGTWYNVLPDETKKAFLEITDSK